MPEPIGPFEPMLRMLNGHSVEQALYVIAVTRIAELLRDEAKSGTELAAATGLDQQALRRLLSMLTAVEVFSQDTAGNYALTELGRTLRSDRALFLAPLKCG
jgi:predicted transcriptional regulator